MPPSAAVDAAHLALALDAEERRLQSQAAADRRHLHHFEATRSSQGGEDGIIDEVFRRIGEESRRFVELGAADGAENCTRSLADAGWGGLWVEGDPARVAAARHAVDADRVQVVQAFLDRDNVCSVLRDAGVAEEFDLLVVDLDGNDRWIREAVASEFRPRAVVLEYNSVFGPWSTWAMPYDATHQWDGTCWFGTSLAAQAAVSERFGYQLVGCDRLGVNAFYVRDELSGAFTPRSVRDHYVGPRYHLPFGHPPVLPPRLEISATVHAGDLALSASLPPPRTLRPGERLYFEAAVRSVADGVVGESAAQPVRLASWWVGADGPVPGEPVRSPQPWQVAPGDTAALVGVAVAPDVPGDLELHIGLVQESRAWLDGPAIVAGGTWRVAATSPT